MELLNIKEEYPSKFYIFVNTLNPMTEHNFKLSGRFTSGAFGGLFDQKTLKKYITGEIRYLPYESCQMDDMALSPYFLTAINDYRIEYDAEVFRKKYYPLYPSRLSAIYAFGDYESCKKASKAHGWDLSTVQKFKLIEHPLNRVVKVNMEHVSLARHAYKVSMLQNIETLWKNYWIGSGNITVELPASNFSRKTFDSGKIWEYLIEGAVEHIR